jgi:hypothetical protein
LGKIAALRHNVGGKFWDRFGQSTRADHLREGRNVASRAPGAILRAIMVMGLIATPTLVIGASNADTTQIVALVALFAGLLTLVEYNTAYPSLVEFRDAPPFNRVRFLMLLLTVYLLSLVLDPGALQRSDGQLASMVGSIIGTSMDFPYSPVRLVTLVVDTEATEAQIAAIRSAAGLAYLASLASLAIFVILLRAGQWPRQSEAFNVWINLPTFDPTHGGDVVKRLRRDARMNIALGFLLPFVIPAVVQVTASGFHPLDMASPQTLVWTITAWSFLPASLFMRGIAMAQVAEMIREARAAHRLEQARSRLATV